MPTYSLTLRSEISRRITTTELDNNFRYLVELQTPILVGTISYVDINDLDNISNDTIKEFLFEDVIPVGKSVTILYPKLVTDLSDGVYTPIYTLNTYIKGDTDIMMTISLNEANTTWVSGYIEVYASFI